MIDSIPQSEPCPVGWIGASIEDKDGNRTPAWVCPNSINTDCYIQRSTLSEEQKERIRKVKWVMKEHDPYTEEEWIRNFQGDRNPEREIQVWESIAQTYREEVKSFVHTRAERLRLYQVLVYYTTMPEKSDLISCLPWVKGYGRLDAVIERYRFNRALRAMNTPE